MYRGHSCPRVENSNQPPERGRPARLKKRKSNRRRRLAPSAHIRITVGWTSRQEGRDCVTIGQYTGAVARVHEHLRLITSVEADDMVMDAEGKDMQSRYEKKCSRLEWHWLLGCC